MLSRRCASRPPRRVVFLGLLGFALGCAHGRLPELPAEQWGSAPQWPAAPLPTRIVWVGELRSSEDIVEARGLVHQLVDTVAGSEDQVVLVRPTAVIADAEAGLIVADPGLPGLLILDTRQGRTQLVRDTDLGPLVSPIGVAPLGDGRFCATDSVLAVVACFAADGKFLFHFGPEGLQRPTGIAFDPARAELLVVDTLAHTVFAYGLDGVRRGSFGGRGEGDGQFNFPVAIALDTEGSAWVADSLNARVQVFSPERAFTSSIGARGDTAGTFARPKGLAIDSDGHVYVTDALFENIQIFDPRGQALLFFGQSGSGPGEFSLPVGLFIDPEDRIYVADSQNGRVQIFRYLK